MTVYEISRRFREFAYCGIEVNANIGTVFPPSLPIPGVACRRVVLLEFTSLANDNALDLLYVSREKERNIRGLDK